ncbi:hypothetical protein JCM14722_02060 [Pseudodesulfovibrio portus]|uniref:Uncharacterized protein n=1 Tax=Pseudodesulfovibrio portus TaxID=231439 RepID=A0ABM8AMR8_9BACT|nr:hypothetical protein JCM14722_02060 [Pseudodesulfovibrio portus]
MAMPLLALEEWGGIISINSIQVPTQGSCDCLVEGNPSFFSRFFLLQNKLITRFKISDHTNFNLQEI